MPRRKEPTYTEAALIGLGLINALSKQKKKKIKGKGNERYGYLPLELVEYAKNTLGTDIGQFSEDEIQRLVRNELYRFITSDRSKMDHVIKFIEVERPQWVTEDFFLDPSRAIYNLLNEAAGDAAGEIKTDWLYNQTRTQKLLPEAMEYRWGQEYQKDPEYQHYATSQNPRDTRTLIQDYQNSLVRPRTSYHMGMPDDDEEIMRSDDEDTLPPSSPPTKQPRTSGEGKLRRKRKTTKRKTTTKKKLNLASFF